MWQLNFAFGNFLKFFSLEYFLTWLVESIDGEPADMKGWLHLSFYHPKVSYRKVLRIAINTGTISGTSGNNLSWSVVSYFMIFYLYS